MTFVSHNFVVDWAQLGALLPSARAASLQLAGRWAGAGRSSMAAHLSPSRSLSWAS